MGIVQNMKSPFTGKEMEIVYEERTWNFRNEEYKYIHAAWLCTDTGEQFTSNEMDDVSYMQVTNQYRAQYGIPFTDEIIATRKNYGISAAKMSQILGIGINQWRNYEAGEVPNVSNGRMIRSIMNPSTFMEYVISAKNILGEKEYHKLAKKVESFTESCQNLEIINHDLRRVYQCERGKENGFAPQSLYRLKNILMYLIENCGEIFLTKMNKLLFYTDFLSYREYGIAMTGLTYRAIEHGPVPERWDRVYSQFDEIYLEPKSYGEKEGYVLKSDRHADLDILTTSEIKTLDIICSEFKNYTSTKMTAISHEESAWIDNVKEYHRIPFESAFKLKAI